MNRVLLFTSFTFFCACTVFAQQKQPHAKDDATIRQMMADQVTEWNKGNIEGFMKGYWKSDSLIFIGSSGPQYGYKTTLERYKARYPDADHMGTLALDIVSIKQISADNYFVIGKWGLKRQAGDVNGAFSLLIKRINGKLVIIADHSS